MQIENYGGFLFHPLALQSPLSPHPPTRPRPRPLTPLPVTLLLPRFLLSPRHPPPSLLPRLLNLVALKRRSKSERLFEGGRRFRKT